MRGYPRAGLDSRWARPTKDSRSPPSHPAPSPCLGQKPGFRSPTERSSPPSRLRAVAGFLSLPVANKNGGAQVWRLSRPRRHPSVFLAFSPPPPLFFGRPSSQGSVSRSSVYSLTTPWAGALPAGRSRGLRLAWPGGD